MKRYIQGMIVLAMVAMVGIPLLAQGYGPNQGKSNPSCPWYQDDDSRPNCPFFDLRESKLSDEQRAQLKKIDDDFAKNMSSIRDEMFQNRQDLAKYLDSQKPDENKVWEVQKKISSLREKMDKEWIKYSLAIKKIAPDARLGDAGRKGRHQRFWSDGCMMRY